MDLNLVGEKVNQFLKEYHDELTEIDVVVGISRGGLIPAGLISAKLDKILIAAYIDRQDSVYLDKPDWIKNKNILLVDDICRTGLTMSLIYKLVESVGPKSIKTFTLFCLEKSSFKPDWTTSIKKDIKLPWD